MGEEQTRAIDDDEHQLLGNTGELTSYDELIEIVARLRLLVREKRRRLNNMSLRDVEELTGINASTIYRFEHGATCRSDALLGMLRFIAEPDTDTLARRTP